MNDAILEFNPKLPKLSQNEKATLKLLVEAGKLIAPIYKLQENQKFPGANFYPHDTTKKEIEKVAKTNPLILFPYTVVERINGKLVAIPYHQKYANFLNSIAQKLEEAARLTENKEFGNALKVQAQALLNGSYEKATMTWLKMKPYILDISIGPNDYFDDRLFFTKTSYQAWVGVMDKEGTERLNDYKSTILNARRKGLIPTEIVSNYDMIKAKTLETILFSGLMARTKFPGVNYPIVIDIVEKYGSEITIFNQPNDLEMQEEIIPMLNKNFSKGFREGYSLEDLRRGNLRRIALHELAHSYLYYKHASDNLQDMFRTLYELAATLLGFRLAGSLLLKNRINEKQLESMLVVFLCKSFYLINKSSKNKSLPEYTLGSAIFINFLVQSGALKNVKGIVVVNFLKVFVALQDLFHILERLLSNGNHKDAEVFLRRYLIEI